MSLSLMDIWNETRARDRAEFMVAVCKVYPSLICEILKKQKACAALEKQGEKDE